MEDKEKDLKESQKPEVMDLNEVVIPQSVEEAEKSEK